ncbi:hypothetical protein [Rhodoferax sp.]|uniref:hypothetical protein n=1 Tax=Rhodoferax sp. TaxID=50421 RepID=UPI002716B7A6|nr:hypothetical protein [Rhodoferax sp.]MDO9198450.1 hypothetical protein [Rhodoferax sp.]
MEHIAPLIQTVLWVGLIAGIVWRFHAPIYGLLVALQKRIETGSNVKAGPFEITDQLKPQDPISQKQKAAVEIQEVVESEDQVATTMNSMADRTTVIQARYFQAEDLVLRAIQAEYGAPLNRQVTAGRDSGFDGLFVSGGRTNVVEVKYIAGKGQYPKIKPAIQRLTEAIQQYGWPNSQIILALVFEHEDDVKHSKELLSSAFAQNVVPVVVRVFTMVQLKAQFGVGEQNEGCPGSPPDLREKPCRPVNLT